MQLQKKKETRSRVCCHLLYRNHKRQSIISASTKLQRYKIPTTMTQSKKIHYPMQFHRDFEAQVWLILLITSATISQLPAIFWWSIHILVFFSFWNFLKLAISAWIQNAEMLLLTIRESCQLVVGNHNLISWWLDLLPLDPFTLPTGGGGGRIQFPSIKPLH